MKIGDLVICIYGFVNERMDWPGITYPKIGQVLTIRTMDKHPIHDFYLLTFEELDTFPLCHLRFRVVEPMPIEELIEAQPLKETV